ncbi:MAG: hypothetical protein IKJ37_12250, partial [Kiritimatiellae bacterium]|nr:hypothetical protein [Kiritimatiellia bacterium]
ALDQPVHHATRRLRPFRSSPPAYRPPDGLPKISSQTTTDPHFYPPAGGTQSQGNCTNCLITI